MTALGAAAAAAVALLALSGCGTAGGVRVAGPDPGPDPGAGSAGPGCGDVAVTPGVPGGATAAPGGSAVTPGAGAREVCVAVGGTLKVRLAPGDREPTESGTALTEVSPGVYRGARAGSAELSGFRRACPDAAPGTMSCHAVAGWKVTVRVR